MLAALRRSLDTWPVRLFFLALVAAFIFWGVAARIDLTGGTPPVARVAGQKIELAQVQAMYQQQLQRLQTSLPPGEQPSGAIRKALAAQVVDQVITTTAVDAAIGQFGVAVPRQALQQAVWAIPAFHGPSGQFDPATFQSVLDRNNLTQAQFLDLMRGDFFGVQKGDVVSAARAAFKGALLVGMGYTPAEGAEAVSQGTAAAIVFGHHYISNPDLVERVRAGAPLVEPDARFFYSPGAKGYTDYPALATS